MPASCRGASFPLPFRLAMMRRTRSHPFARPDQERTTGHGGSRSPDRCSGIRPRWRHLEPALLILGLAVPGAIALAQEGNASQGAQIAAIQKIGGKVERDDKAPEKPVMRVNLSITKAGDANLVHVKGLDKLKVLSLNNTPITDAGLEHLKGLASLEKLYLVDTKVGNAGFEHLKGLANLKELFVAGTNVREDGAKELKESLPKALI
jgi:hypothetical protein